MPATFSPRHRITPTDASFLLIHGDADPLVPIEQSHRFVTALKDAGVPWSTLREEVEVLADWFRTELAHPKR